MDTKFKFRIIVYISITVIILLAFSMLCRFFGVESRMDQLMDINYFDLLTAQIANTLIVLSLTSVLSTNFGQAYWVDIKDTKLITPFYGCFIGITVYLLTGLVYSVFSYALDFKAGIVVSAVGTTILLIILTFKMISIYFGKEELKKQLRMEYKREFILNNTPYVTDYLRRLEQFLKFAETEEFPGKGKFIARLKKEIMEVKDGLDSGDEEKVDKCHKDHIDKYMKGMDELQKIDLKIEEYTQNAISNNDTEVVRENIELLVESENYDTFFNLLEELFDWDEKYACRMLREISRKNRAWVIKDKMSFFKQYALQKLISESGKLDAIQNLLLIYDPSNLGMNKLKPQIQTITNECCKLKELSLHLDNELSTAEDMRECMRKQREERNKIKEQDDRLKTQLLELLNTAPPKALRSFYIPIREACRAYDEGKYEIVIKYVTIILTDFEQDLLMIKSSSGIFDVYADIEFSFSYVTEEESSLIALLLEKDMEKMVIPESAKERLSSLSTVTINNYSM